MTINSSDTPNKKVKQGGYTSGIPIGSKPGSSKDKPARPSNGMFGNPLQQSKVKRKNNGQN